MKTVNQLVTTLAKAMPKLPEPQLMTEAELVQLKNQKLRNMWRTIRENPGEVEVDAGGGRGAAG